MAVTQDWSKNRVSLDWTRTKSGPLTATVRGNFDPHPPTSSKQKKELQSNQNLKQLTW